MLSNLERLFRFAKATEAEARENFTTEALAAAIRSEPGPFLAVLRAHGLAGAEATLLAVETQVPLAGQAGQRRLDLGIELGPLGKHPPVWIEVKVGAPESGNQLDMYANYAARLPEDVRPRLVVLAPKPLRQDVPWISWQQIRAAIMASGTSNLYWRDLTLYLEEIGMADSYSDPLTSNELAALAPARALFGKIARILTPFVAEALVIWPDSYWPATEPEVQRALSKFLISHGSLTIESRTKLRANVSAGAYHDTSTQDAWLGLWVWASPRRLAERDRIFRHADKGGLSDDWYRKPVDWELLLANRQLSEFADHATATAWLIERLRDLDRTGLLALLPKLGAVAPGEEDDEPEERMQQGGNFRRIGQGPGVK